MGYTFHGHDLMINLLNTYTRLFCPGPVDLLHCLVQYMMFCILVLLQMPRQARGHIPGAQEGRLQGAHGVRDDFTKFHDG